MKEDQDVLRLETIHNILDIEGRNIVGVCFLSVVIFRLGDRRFEVGGLQFGLFIDPDKIRIKSIIG